MNSSLNRIYSNNDDLMLRVLSKKGKEKLRVLFIDPPSYITNPFHPGWFMHSAALLGIATYVRERSIRETGKDGHYEVAILDANAEYLSWSQVEERIKAFAPDVVVLTAYTCTAYAAMYSMHLAKKNFPDVITLAGGFHFAYLPELSLRMCDALDFIGTGEGELTTFELLEAIRTGTEITKVRGLKFLDRTVDMLVETPPAPLIHDLDTLPIPDYSLLPLDRYDFPIFPPEKQSNPGASARWFSDSFSISSSLSSSSSPSISPSSSSSSSSLTSLFLSPFSFLIHSAGHLFSSNHREHVMGVSFSRGCTGSCHFCSNSNIWGRTWRGFSGKRVVDELELLYTRYGKNHFFFFDNDFFLSPQRNAEFIHEMSRRKLPVKFWTETSIRAMWRDRELIHRYAKAGLRIAMMGYEFMRASQLERHGKTHTLEMGRKVYELLSHHGVMVHSMVIIGDRHDSEKTLSEVIEYFSEVIPSSWVATQILTPVPGSALFNEALEKGWVHELDFEKYDMFTPVMPTEYASIKDMQEWTRKVNLISAFKPFRIKRYLHDEYERRLAFFIFKTMLLKLKLSLKNKFFPEKEYEKYRKILLEKQRQILEKDPAWEKSLKAIERLNYRENH